MLSAACPRAEPQVRPSAPVTPVLTTAPTPSTSPSDDRVGGTFHYAVTEPRSLDPVFAVDVEDFAVVDQVYDSLTAVSDTLEVVPAAASAWEANDDFTQFTFHLRAGATFHAVGPTGAQPVTASSFARAWQRIVDQTQTPPSPAHYHLAPVAGYTATRDSGVPLEGVEVVDDLTLRVTLSAPLAAFPAVVSYPGLAPAPDVAFDDPTSYADVPIGNGPFKVAEPWRDSDAIRVQRFDEYYGEPALLDEIVFRVYSGETAIATAYSEFEGDLLHFAPVPPEQMVDAAAAYGRSTDGYTGPGVLDGNILVTYFYAFDTTLPPFDDANVRRGLSMLVDRDAIASEVMDGTRLPAAGIVPSGIAGYTPALCVYCVYDPERARRTLAGATPLTPFEIWIYEGSGHALIAQRVERDMEAVLGDGMVAVRELDGDSYVDAIRNGVDGARGGFFLGGWFADYPTPDNFLHALFHSATVGVENLSRFADPAVDALIDQARNSDDDLIRADRYRRAEARVLNEMPVTPVVVYRHTRVVDPRVHGFVYTPLKTVDMTKVWLEGGG